MKKDKELQTVAFMIGLYCNKKHKSKKGELCEDCRRLWEYVQTRRGLCPFGDDKPFCSNCTIHCYKPEMREKIKQVMRFAGPRMMLYHPVIAMRHVIETAKRKSKQKNKSKKEK